MEQKRVKVRDVMRSDVTMVDGRTSVLDALKIMKQVKATSLIIDKRDEHDEYGLLLFSDIAKQVLAHNRAPERVNVYEIMVKPVVFVRPNMDIRYCARLFERVDITHAPVIDGDNVIGIVSYYLLVLEGLAGQI